MTESSDERAERGARLVAAGIIVSRIAGLVRNSLFAMIFGRGVESDAYTAASKIPNVMRNLLGEGAISASFVPVYAAALERGDERGARALANALLGVLLVGVSLLTIVGVVASPLLARTLVAGFEVETLRLTTELMRVLFPMTGLMVLSGWCLGVQNANRRFFLAYASAAAWSAMQIAVLVYAWWRGSDLTTAVWWVSWATLAGALLQITVQMPQVTRLLGSVRPALDLTAPGIRDTLRNFLPVVAALGAFQISSLIDIEIASFLPSGAATSLNYAAMIYLLPLSLFGVANAAAALPELARQRERGESAALGAGVARAWERVLFYTVPSAVAFVAIGDLIVGALYRGRNFGAESQFVVHMVLAAYAIGLTAYASSRLLAASFQAVRDYRTPLRAAGAGVALSGVAALAFAIPFRTHEFSVVGIAAGSALGAFANLWMLQRGLGARIGVVDATGPVRVLRLALIAAMIAAIATVPFRLAFDPLHVRMQAVAIIPLFCVVFVWFARRSGLAEADRLIAIGRSLVARLR